MGKVLIEESTLTAIGDSIRGKTGKTAKIPPLNMPSEISGIETGGNYQAKTATPLTSAQTIKPDSGYDALSQVTVNAMPTATQATPSISVSSGGLITASATQTEGFVVGGTKSATQQLSTQAAKTVTPSSSSQTAVASGKYTTGAVTVAAIPSTYKRVATGTFTMNASSYNLKTYPISVSGLGFTPTRVMAVLESVAASNAYDAILGIDGDGTTTYVVYAEEGGYDCDECQTPVIYTSAESGTVVSLTTFSGGFRISATSLAIGAPAGATFRYIAIG